MLKGKGNGDVQGIFGANHHADTHKSVFTNFLVEDNIYFDTGLNAIQFYSGETMTVRNNTVLADPADGRVVWVRLHGPQTNSVIEDNVATQVNAESGTTASGNIIAQFRDPSNANYYGDLFVDPFADPATLEGLAPKPGAIGYGSGKGAEERFQELLSGGGAPDSSRTGTSDSETPVAGDGPADNGSTADAPVAESPADDGAEVDGSVVDGPADDGPAVDGNDSDEDSADQSGSVPPVLIAEPDAFHGKGSEVVQADTATSVGDEHDAAVSFGRDERKLDLKGALVDSNGGAEPVMAGAGQDRSGNGLADNLADVFHGSGAGEALDEEPAGGDGDGFLLS
jgi:hypothetical protein